jgi:hypothetical protein
MRGFGAFAALGLLTQAGPLTAQPAVLPADTAIHLATSGQVSSKTAKVGDRVGFIVREPVVVGGTTIIPAGSPAAGEVTRVRDNGLLGRSGKLEISVSYVNAVGGLQIPVKGNSGRKGASGVPAVVGAAIVFLPLGIFMKGREARIKEGTPVDVYVAKDVQLETPAAAPGAEPAPQPQQPQVTSVPIPASNAGPLPD